MWIRRSRWFVIPLAIGSHVASCSAPTADATDEAVASVDFEAVIAGDPNARTLVVPDLADPEIFKEDDDLFFLMGSATVDYVSLPIYQSTDLVNFTLKTRYDPAAVDPAHRYCDLWAPDLSKHNGVYHLYFSANRVPKDAACPTAGQDVTTFHATAPNTNLVFGPPELVNQGTPFPRSQIAAGCPSDGCEKVIRIDTSVVDVDGQRRLFYVWFDRGNNISSVPFSSPGSITSHAGPARFPLAAYEETINEGSDVFVRDGKYYMFFSGGQFNGQYAMYYIMGNSVTDLTRARQVRRHSIPRRSANGTLTETHGHNSIVTRRGEYFNFFHVGAFNAAGGLTSRSTYQQRLAFKPDGSIAALNFVDLRWGKLGNHIYSLDVVKHDGTAHGPCIGADVLGSATAGRYAGSCPSANGVVVPKNQIKSFRLYYADDGVWTKFVERAYDGVSDQVFLDIPGAATQTITVGWTEKATGTEYSLDVQRADGTWIAPCVGDHVLATGITHEFTGACPTANTSVSLANISQLQICSAVNDDWARARCGSTAYDGKQGFASIVIP